MEGAASVVALWILSITHFSRSFCETSSNSFMSFHFFLLSSALCLVVAGVDILRQNLFCDALGVGVDGLVGLGLSASKPVFCTVCTDSGCMQ